MPSFKDAIIDELEKKYQSQKMNLYMKNQNKFQNLLKKLQKIKKKLN